MPILLPGLLNGHICCHVSNYSLYPPGSGYKRMMVIVYSMVNIHSFILSYVLAVTVWKWSIWLLYFMCFNNFKRIPFYMFVHRSMNVSRPSINRWLLINHIYMCVCVSSNCSPAVHRGPDWPDDIDSVIPWTCACNHMCKCNPRTHVTD